MDRAVFARISHLLSLQTCIFTYKVRTTMSTHKSSKKRGPGRERRANPHLVLGLANVLRTQFSQAWPILGNQLLDAKSPEEVMSVLKKDGGQIGGLKGLGFSTRVFEIIHRDRKFPCARLKSQIHFLADSLGAEGVVTFRRSREICAIERKKVRHRIVRREFYIECTCTYRGPALNGGCPDCGTIELSQELMQREDYDS
jgi:hypothetical protein